MMYAHIQHTCIHTCIHCVCVYIYSMYQHVHVLINTCILSNHTNPRNLLSLSLSHTHTHTHTYTHKYYIHTYNVIIYMHIHTHTYTHTHTRTHQSGVHTHTSGCLGLIYGCGKTARECTNIVERLQLGHATLSWS